MRYLLFTAIISFLFISCGNDETNPSSIKSDVTAPPAVVPGGDGISETKVILDETGKPTVIAKPVNAVTSMTGPSPKSKIDAIPPKVYLPQPQTEQEKRVIRVLTTHHWVIQTLIRIKDRPANMQNQGVWFKFNPNGTYEYGFFSDKIGSGSWTFDGQNALLHLDSELLGDDREWNIKIGNEEDLMIWVGTERYTTADIQMRLYNFIAIPRNRTEMGLKEKNGALDQF